MWFTVITNPLTGLSAVSNQNGPKRVRARTHTHTHPHAHPQMKVWAWGVTRHKWFRMHATFQDAYEQSRCVCVCARARACVCASVCAQVSVRANVCVCAHACTCTCVYVRYPPLVGREALNGNPRKSPTSGSHSHGEGAKPPTHKPSRLTLTNPHPGWAWIRTNIDMPD